MTRYEELEQLQAYSRVDGALMAVLWTVSFACFVGNFVNPLLGMVSFVVGAVSLALAAQRVRRFRDEVRDGVIGFGSAFGYSALQYMHAALLFAVVQFVYFRFIDQGFLMSRYQAIAGQKEFQSMMATWGLKADDIALVMQNLNALRPIDIALQFFTTNVMMGLAMSLPVAAMMRRTGRR